MKDEGDPFQLAYARIRALLPFGPRVGLDLDLEAGLSHNLPLDRWWPFGGGAQLLGSRALGILAPDFVSTRLGLPLRFSTGWGLTLELEPRVDLARFAATSNALGPDSLAKAQGIGLMARTLLGQIYVEAAYGFMKLQAPGLDGRSRGHFSLLVGSQPFDLWKRR